LFTVTDIHQQHVFAMRLRNGYVKLTYFAPWPCQGQADDIIVIYIIRGPGARPRQVNTSFTVKIHSFLG